MHEALKKEVAVVLSGGKYTAGRGTVMPTNTHSCKNRSFCVWLPCLRQQVYHNHPVEKLTSNCEWN